MKGGLTQRYHVATHMLSRQLRLSRFGLKTAKDGFTIVEVMIVLAVTGALFISAATMISGRQNKTEFTIAINEVQSQIQQIISDVGTGYYPSASGIACTLNAATNSPSFASGGATQGTNQDCTFMGKVVQFGVKNTTPEQFWTYSLAGLRQISLGGTVRQDAQTIVQANPKIMTLNINSPGPAPTVSLPLENGLKAGKMTYTNAGVTKNIVAIAFVSDLSGGGGANLTSGAQAVNVLPIVSATNQVVPDTTSDVATSVNANLITSVVNPDGGVSICFVSGTTQQIGIITIGGSNERQNSVTLSIRSTSTCP